MPRVAASCGWMRTGSRPSIFEARLVAPKSNWLCNRVAGWFAISCNGKRGIAVDPAPSTGASHVGWPGQSSYPNPATVADVISILPLAVGKGAPSGFRQYDIGVVGARRPRRILNDHGVRLCKAAMQSSEILVMVERVATGPINQLDVGIGQLLPVVVERFARMQQHVGYARDRDEIGDTVASRRRGWQRHRERWFAGIR